MTEQKHTIKVVRLIEVTVDESKFTPEFMGEFRRHFYPSFHTISDHADHLAALYASGVIHDLDPDPFVEGYGRLSEFGVEFRELNTETEAVRASA